jgi:hypothetical protein
MTTTERQLCRLSLQSRAGIVMLGDEHLSCSVSIRGFATYSAGTAVPIHVVIAAIARSRDTRMAIHEARRVLQSP